MKKFFANLFILIMGLFLSNMTLASSPMTEIRIKVGESILKVNGNLIVANAASFTQNGSLMVPIKNVADSFGAKLEWNSKEKSERISSGNTNIKFFIGKKKIVVDGVEKESICASKILNNTMMIPVRIIIDNFGGQIKFDSANKEWIILIPIKDYENRFKYIFETKIGDSFYGWEVAYPKGCQIVEKKASGESVLVKNTSAGYYYYIYNIKAADIYNEQDLLNMLLSYREDERLVSQKIIDARGRKWASVVLEDEYQICEYRATIYNNRVYQLHFYTSNKNEFLKGDKNYIEIINSFNLGYEGNKQGIRNINEINSGMYTYYEKNYGWSINLPVNINRDIKKSENIYWVIDENGMDNGITCGIEVDTVDTSETLKSYVEERVNGLSQEAIGINLVQPRVEDFTVGGIPGKKVVYEADTGSNAYLFYDLYLIKDKYKYNVCFFGKKEEFTDEKIKLCNKVFRSFTPANKERTLNLKINSKDEI